MPNNNRPRPAAAPAENMPGEMRDETGNENVDEKAEPATEKNAPREEKRKPVADDGFSVYLGPSIRAVIQNGTVYKGSKAKVLKKLKEPVGKYPLIASLIVPGDALPEARIKVKTPGNLLYVNYGKLAEALKTT